MTTKIISAASTIIWGVLTTAALVVISFIVTSLSPLHIPTLVVLIICLGLPGLVLINGFTTIQPTQTGLFNIFGTRQRTSITEGLTWLPPFTSVTIFDNKEQTTDIGETEILATNQISIKIKLSFNWHIIDNYKFSNLDKNVIEKGFSELVRNEVRSEILKTNLNDINLINSNKSFVSEIVKSCNETAEDKWGILFSQLFISTIRPTTENMRNYYESKAKIGEIAEDAAKLAIILNISPRDALDKYARERLKIHSIENIYSLTEISHITSLIEKLIRK